MKINQVKMNEKTIGVCSVTKNIIPYYMCKKCLNRKLWEGKEVTLITKNGLKKAKKQPCVFIPLKDFPIEKRRELIQKFKMKVKEYAIKRNTNN